MNQNDQCSKDNAKSQYHQALEEEENKKKNNESEIPHFDIISLDDDESLNIQMERRITDAQLKIMITTNLADFEKVITKNTCNVFLIDLGLEHKANAGLEAIEMIHSKSLGPSRIFVLSAQSDGETIASALEMGAHDYLSKPVDFDYLISLTKSNLGINSDLSKYQKLFAVKGDLNCLISLPLKVLKFSDYGLVLHGPVMVAKGTTLKIQNLELNKQLNRPLIKLEVTHSEAMKKDFILVVDFVDKTQEMGEDIRKILLDESISYESLFSPLDNN